MGGGPTRNAQIGNWLEGVDVPNTEGGSGTPGVQVGQPQWQSRDPQDPRYSTVTQNLVNSGATLLTEMGLDQNTRQFITAQAMKGKSKVSSRGVSLPREIASDTSIVPGHAVRGRELNTGALGNATAAARQVECSTSGVNNMATGMQNIRNFGAVTAEPGRQAPDPDSDGESSVSLIKKGAKTKKSGMLAMPSDNIKTPQIWPHYNLAFGFVTAAPQFHQLTFEQYVAGETKTVADALDPLEVKGRLGLMSRLSYLKHKGHAWPNLRTLYAAIVNHIEKHEASWVSDWKYIEDMVLESSIRIPGEKGVGKKVKMSQPEQWYCREFNRPEGCTKAVPHDANIRGRRRQV